jgi:hypothetical protein
MRGFRQLIDMIFASGRRKNMSVENSKMETDAKMDREITQEALRAASLTEDFPLSQHRNADSWKE